MKRNEVDRSKLSPVMIQYMDIKDKYEDCIIFFRLGDFYEMFFDDAILISRVLELTLTGKQAGLEERVPMCGIPYHAYAGYANKLIDQGYKLAIVEQLEDPKDTKGMVKRDVVQIVTKGTRLDNNIDAKSNNYISSIYSLDNSYVLSYVDISTGEFYAQVLEQDNAKILEKLSKLGITETIVNNDTDRILINDLRTKLNVLVTITDNIITNNDYEYIYSKLEDERIVKSIKHLLYYILDTKKGDMHHLKEVKVIKYGNYLEFDVNTKNNLELTETIRERTRQYSLFWLLDKCKTAMGSRYLKYNIENPLRDKKEIERRYDIVENLSTQFILRDDLIKELTNVYDLERLCGRISYGNLNAKDLIQLKNSLSRLPKIKEILQELKYDKTINTYDELYTLLDKSINEDAPFTLHEGRLIKDNYNEELDELKSISSGSKDFIIQLEQEEKERTGIKNLKVGYNKVFGYYIEVSKSGIKEIKDEYGYIRKQTLANAERYITPVLKEKENIILGAEEKIINLEYKLFMDIREVVKRYIKDLQETSITLSEIDMLQSFSIISDQNKYVRPTITKSREVELINSRHPVVEKVLSEKYVANDIVMDNKTNILLITGPNMAGKSTYLRQFAINVIMAQIGCFVPCTSAKMPIFDKIFTRIGASDNLVSGESTFMIEMKEANLAIQEATNDSLILFDELGRGTATYDGMALAQSILEYIHDKIKCKMLFSTHYHELTMLERDLKQLKNIHVEALEENHNITFLHKVKNGAIDKSYGINVARLANLPESLIDRANEVLDIYENKSNKKEVFTQTSLFDLDEEEIKEESKNDKIIDKINNSNPIEMTPMEAINFLYEIKKELKDNK